MTASPYHIVGPCEAAYIRGCRCPECRIAHRENTRRREHRRASPLAIEVEQLTAELDAAELNLEALREENRALRCRIDDLETDWLPPEQPTP